MVSFPYYSHIFRDSYGRGRDRSSPPKRFPWSVGHPPPGGDAEDRCERVWTDLTGGCFEKGGWLPATGG